MHNKNKILFIDVPRNKEGKGYTFNQMLLWLASYARQLGMESFIYVVEKPSNKSFLNEIKFIVQKHDISLILISNKWWHNLYAVVELVTLLKNTLDVPITIGGINASCFYRELSDIADAVVVGDGFKFLEEYSLQTPSKELCEIGNVACKYKKEVKNYNHYSIDRPILHEKLEDLFVKDDFIKYVNGYVWAGVGCTESCFYCVCGNPNPWLPTYRMRPSQNILHDIHVLSKYRKHIFFDFDDSNPHDYKYQQLFVELFDKLNVIDMYLSFFSWIKPTYELVDSISRKFKFSTIYVDVLSFSEHVRNRIRGLTKETPTFEDISNLLTYVEKRDMGNIFIGTTGIFGYPFVYKDNEIEEEIQYIKKLISFAPYRGMVYSFLHVLPCSFKNLKYSSLLRNVKLPLFNDYLKASRLFYHNSSIRYYSYDIMKLISPYSLETFDLMYKKYIHFNNKLKDMYTPKINITEHSIRIADKFNPFNTLLTILEDLATQGNRVETIIIDEMSYLYNDIVEHMLDSSEILTKLEQIEYLIKKIKASNEKRIEIIVDNCERLGFLKELEIINCKNGKDKKKSKGIRWSR